ncbi:MAG: hypothetical protein LBK42_13680 [Propionibacteriaceae bacterium]|nr:hypothetical protein [Propionibacteriaceae bacterium]
MVADLRRCLQEMEAQLQENMPRNSPGAEPAWSPPDNCLARAELQATAVLAAKTTLDACRDAISGVNPPSPSAEPRRRAESEWRQLEANLSLTDLWDRVNALHTDSESIRLILHVANALASFRPLLSAAGRSDATTAIEINVQRVLEIHRAILLSAPPGDELIYANDQADAFFRVIISFATVVSILSQSEVTRRNLGWEWGQHLWSSHEFEAIDFTPFEPPAPPGAAELLLPDQFDELKSALQTLSAVACSTNMPATSEALGRVESFGRCACSLMNTNWEPGVEPTDPPTFDIREACAELNKTQRQIARMIALGHILSVRRWNGDLAFPTFQFCLGTVRDIVSETLPYVPAEVRGWQMSHFLFALDQEALSSGNVLSVARVKEILEKRDLWQPAWGDAGHDDAGDVKHKQLAIGRKLYRVTGAEYSPFFFSSTPGQHGRYDLPDSCGRGTNYLAGSRRGAWGEVLDRQLLVSLRALMGRTVWELSPQGASITLINLTGIDQSGIPRGRTQAQALTASKLGAAGIEYHLRSKLEAEDGEIGVALFGPVGACLPGDTGTGVWSAVPHSAMNDSELWAYLKERRDKQSWLPIKLRRFPDEVSPRSISPIALNNEQLQAARRSVRTISQLFDI